MDKSKLIAIAKARPFSAEYLAFEINKQCPTVADLKTFIIELDSDINGHPVSPYDQPDFNMVPLITINHCAVHILKKRLNIKPFTADPASYFKFKQSQKVWGV